MDESTQLKKAGLKITNPRLKILQLLEKSGNDHLSAEDIYKSLKDNGEDVGLATVYRVLSQFEEAHIIQKHSFIEGISVYELCRGEHHDHLVCVECGKVEEFVDPIIEKRQKEVAVKANFTMTSHCLNLYGMCATCR